MKIIPDASEQGIYSIIIEDNIVKNSLGHPLGTQYYEVYSNGNKQKCQLGEDSMSGRLLCYAPKHPNILYVFNDKKDTIPATIPSPDVLKAWALESIIWRPKT